MVRGAETAQKWGQVKETVEIVYIYRAVLATNKTITGDPDSKFHTEAAKETEILAFQYTKRAEIKTAKDFLPRSP